MDKVVEKVARAIVEFWGEDPDRPTTSGQAMWRETAPVARVAITALEAGGWRVVPAEPTEEMIKKAVDTEGMKAVATCIMLSFIHNCPLPKFETSPLHQAYKAMLDAAPKLNVKGE